MDTGTSRMSSLPLWAQIPSLKSFYDLSHVWVTGPCPLSGWRGVSHLHGAFWCHSYCGALWSQQSVVQVCSV